MRKQGHKRNYQAVVIGASTGGMEALKTILPVLPANFQVPVMIAQHISPYSENYMARYFAEVCRLTVKEADEKEKVKPGTVYIAPPNYHLLVEKDWTLSLSVDPKVNYARPSIDVLFETAADAFADRLIGVVLTGANRDGSCGIRKVKDLGGLVIVQDPETSVADSMPKAAIQSTQADYILPPAEIALTLIQLLEGKA
jgi:two-component system chemotaxis response regulator CheB